MTRAVLITNPAAARHAARAVIGIRDTLRAGGWDVEVRATAEAGDVLLFASDVWHRRLPPTADDPGRYFVQCHYGRRDLAQRLQPTAVANQLSSAAIERAESKRDRTLIGLHDPFFYDG